MRTILIGVGGATCSGKTTLAKHLQKCLPGSYIIHQDDFAPPSELVPMNEKFGVQDWDDPVGAIDWPRMRSALAHVKSTGSLPSSHYSHDHLNAQTEVPLPAGMTEFWNERFQDATKKYLEKEGLDEEGEGIQWAILDGFLLYYDDEIRRDMDIRVMLRVPEAELVARRNARPGYNTAAQSDPEGLLWTDPPGYWENIVYPAYIKAHSHLFLSSNIETGQLVPDSGIELLEADQLTMAELLDGTCRRVLEFIGGEIDADEGGDETPGTVSPIVSEEGDE